MVGIHETYNVDICRLGEAALRSVSTFVPPH